MDKASTTEKEKAALLDTPAAVGIQIDDHLNGFGRVVNLPTLVDIQKGGSWSHFRSSPRMMF
jgi:hypothetical protein